MECLVKFLWEIFRAYVRASNGLQYIINPEEMQNVVLPISYTVATAICKLSHLLAALHVQ
jgi:hypothetical protein